MISYDKVSVKMCKYFSLKFKNKKQNGSSKSYDRRPARHTRHVSPITRRPYSPCQPDYNARQTRHVSPIKTLALLAMSARLKLSPYSPCQPDYNARQTRHVSPITTLASLAHSAPLWFQYSYICP